MSSRLIPPNPFPIALTQDINSSMSSVSTSKSKEFISAKRLKRTAFPP